MQKQSRSLLIIYFILFVMLVIMFSMKNNIEKALVNQNQLADTMISLIDAIVPGEM